MIGQCGCSVKRFAAVRAFMFCAQAVLSNAVTRDIDVEVECLWAVGTRQLFAEAVLTPSMLRQILH